MLASKTILTASRHPLSRVVQKVYPTHWFLVCDLRTPGEIPGPGKRMKENKFINIR